MKIIASAYCGCIEVILLRYMICDVDILTVLAAQTQLPPTNCALQHNYLHILNVIINLQQIKQGHSGTVRTVTISLT